MVPHDSISKVILSDRELNPPKITDFGMARIFGGSEDMVKTREWLEDSKHGFLC